uniref:Uncharacterized protein n=1 Tax=Megaselia scalaris TaxID=36166 RepID=T1GBE9_MEGSC
MVHCTRVAVGAIEGSVKKQNGIDISTLMMMDELPGVKSIWGSRSHNVSISFIRYVMTSAHKVLAIKSSYGEC